MGIESECIPDVGSWKPHFQGLSFGLGRLCSQEIPFPNLLHELVRLFELVAQVPPADQSLISLGTPRGRQSTASTQCPTATAPSDLAFDWRTGPAFKVP
jgi:hypothetical protein